MTKHYVEFFYSGTFFSETSTKEVPSRKLDQSDIPANCFAYRFFDREEVTHNEETLVGSRKNVGGMMYIGERFSIARLKKEHSDKRTLISNIENNGFEAAVLTRMGNWQGLGKEDVVIQL